MARTALRRIACVAAMLALGVASSPRVQAATVAPVTPSAAAAINANHVTSPATALVEPNVTGKGWGTMLACAGCVVAATAIVAAGPAAIVVAIHTPGSALALLACTAACYEAFQ